MADLSTVGTKRDLIAKIEQRYSLPYEQALPEVETWAFGRQFGTWTAQTPGGPQASAVQQAQSGADHDRPNDRS